LKDLIFYDASPEDEARYGFEPSLFHLPQHLYLQRANGWRWFYASDRKHGRVVTSLFVNVTNGMATTAVKGPYGTIECADDTAPEELFQFLRFVDETLASARISSCEIKMSPQAYAPPLHTLTMSFLHVLGFRTTGVDISSCMEISQPFADTISKTENQVIQKALQAGLTATRLPVDSLDEVYGFIAHHHDRKAYPLSMTLNALRETVQYFPDRYLLFGTFDRGTLVAAAIGIRISPTVMNLFYIDHDSAYDKLSPAVLTISALHAYCIEHHMPLLDLGTSSLQQGPNFGLLSFKLRMGAYPSIKPTLQKVYSQ
jgi:hypothetical protein